MGFIVSIGADDVTAINEETAERFIARFDADHFYDAVVQLAQQVGHRAATKVNVLWPRNGRTPEAELSV